MEWGKGGGRREGGGRRRLVRGNKGYKQGTRNRE